MMHLQFSCSLWDEATPLPHFWEHTVGSGHAPLALRGDCIDRCTNVARSSAFVRPVFTGCCAIK